MQQRDRKYSKRAIFPAGKQREFIVIAQTKLGVNSNNLGALLGVHGRTVRDWRREKFSMSLSSVEKICTKLNILLPTDITIQDPFWYASKGAKSGWKAMYKKYGRVPVDPEYRKQKWREWWEREGKFSTHPIINRPLPIHFPLFSTELAELTGIIMGDGGITKNQVTVSTSSVTDQEHAYFVKGLIEKLFHIPVAVRYRRDFKAVNVIASRVMLVKFCHEKLGLHVGNKLAQGLDIPNWVKNNLEYQKACLRGLVDTDGCLFYERHHIKGKVYSYPRLNFVSYSPSLRASVFTILKKLDFSPQLRGNRAVQLENKAEILHYFDTVGSHNPKHIGRLLAQ